jgi:hypothetical protein
MPPAPNPDATAAAAARLSVMNGDLAVLELNVEFYLLGGAFMYQAFQADPPTAHISALFRPSRPVREVAARIAAREGWPYEWLSEAVKAYLAGGAWPGPFLELSNLNVFHPPLAYALAVKVAALRVEHEPREVDDVRYVLRALNVMSPDEALEIVGRYFSDRQLAPETGATLRELLETK